ncbi:MerR family transcriptional regulator [Gordonia phthalatica]|uniref:MerR family transcriptional regulator n=1 Tax=Gordonia phthalatica TaxID=1136941 RepID=A0A0N9NFL3_9ACTN|nr:MerR family transcriptional regulator [Gordonia phthalatica]ALG86482.1 MerR family transcriptional regulator [Gordonia phthalatica]
MRIGELADRAGVSTRALRHYEDRGLLIPDRDGNDYRRYRDDDLVRVAQIRMMLDAGLNTDVIGRYLECARGDHEITVEMCPDLRAELDALDVRLRESEEQIRATRQRLEALTRRPG